MKYLFLITLTLVLIQCQKEDFRDDLIGKYEVHLTRDDDTQGPTIKYECDTIISVYKGASDNTFSIMDEDLEIGYNLELKNPASLRLHFLLPKRFFHSLSLWLSFFL